MSASAMCPSAVARYRFEPSSIRCRWHALDGPGPACFRAGRDSVENGDEGAVLAVYGALVRLVSERLRRPELDVNSLSGNRIRNTCEINQVWTKIDYIIISARSYEVPIVYLQFPSIRVRSIRPLESHSPVG